MLTKLYEADGFCECGKEHKLDSKIYSGKGAVNSLADIIRCEGARSVYVVADNNTYSAGGEAVCRVLDGIGASYEVFNFGESPFPNEEAVEAVYHAMPKSADMIVAIGSGVINDISKIIAKECGLKFVIVATAPSMDGYASNTSSMTFRGLKISHPSGAAKYIIGDTDILVTAPVCMMVSGIGDMLAKFVSICEWRIANLLFGEYYCEKIADLVRYSLKKCLEDTPALMRREPEAVENVFAALTISSVAMNYAGVSRPASGCEHYISHMLDMRGEEFNTPTDFHGTQCATATYIVTKLYEKIKAITPDENKAISRMADFKYEDRAKELRRYLGKAAESMIALEAKEKKFTRENHEKRLKTLVEKWDALIAIVNEELPSVEYLDEVFASLGLNKDFSYLGIDKDTERRAFLYSGDIRDKYVLSRLAMDIGLDKDLAELI